MLSTVVPVGSILAFLNWPIKRQQLASCFSTLFFSIKQNYYYFLFRNAFRNYDLFVSMNGETEVGVAKFDCEQLVWSVSVATDHNKLSRIDKYEHKWIAPKNNIFLPRAQIGLWDLLSSTIACAQIAFGSSRYWFVVTFFFFLLFFTSANFSCFCPFIHPASFG